MKILQRIDIYGLWHTYTLSWHIYRNVNVLSGINGSGKSTILKCLATILNGDQLPSYLAKRIDGISITFDDNQTLEVKIIPIYTKNIENNLPTEKEPETPNNGSPQVQRLHQAWFISGKEVNREEVLNFLSDISVDYIATFDSPAKSPDSPSKKIELFLRSTYSELDRHLDHVVEEYRTYQIENSKKMESLMMQLNLKSRNHEVVEKLQAIFERRNHLQDLIDEMMKESGKHLNREIGNMEFIFHADNKSHPFRELSAGEKQLLLILLKVFMQESRNAILIMDEPEISLHVDWQENLIDKILQLNPNCQLIISTHSPAVILKGWQSSVVNISDIAKQQ